MDIGADLRNARIARNRSLEDISRSTKISSSVLRSIENEAFDRVPKGVFTRGYLRAYAREVGLDPDELVHRYRAKFEPPEPPPDTDRPDAPVTVALTRLIHPDEEADRSERTRVMELVVIAGIAVVCFALLRQATPSQRVETPSAIAEAPAVALRTPDAPVATSGRNAPSELSVDIRPRGPCWVEATADGERVVAKLMNAGDRQVVTVRDDVILRVGDPAAFAFSIDGVSGRPFGRAGQPEWIRITRQNYETFLERR
jgi:cytoskeleton protein RodZ